MIFAAGTQEVIENNQFLLENRTQFEPKKNPK